MANVEKYKMSAVVNILRHNDRLIQHPSNTDIEANKQHLNTDLTPDRNMSAYDYFKERKSQVYCYNRDDVKVLAGWVVTLPKDITDATQETQFFEAVNDFLHNRYGQENCIQSIIHRDESGQPHLHYTFIPVTFDVKKDRYKICANDVINRIELRNFHPDLQKHLDRTLSFKANVLTGITKQQGGNRTVKNLKLSRPIERQQSFGRWS